MTRRETLAAATSGLALLAGCSGSNTAEITVPGPSGTPLDYDFDRVRVSGQTVLFAEMVHDGESDRTAPRNTGVLRSASDLEQYDFPQTDAAQRLRSFATETDFATESVLLHANTVGACYDLRLETVTLKDDDHPQVELCRSLRPADVACAADATDTVGFAIRVSVPGEDLSGFGMGLGRCSNPSRPPTFDGTVAVDGEETG